MDLNCKQVFNVRNVLCLQIYTLQRIYDLFKGGEFVINYEIYEHPKQTFRRIYNDRVKEKFNLRL